MINRSTLVNEAWRWVGTPYHHQARVLGAGVDCVHLLCAIFEAAGASSPIDPGLYAREWHLHRSDELYMQAMDARMARTSAPRVGDVALFKFGRCYSHGAVLVNDTQVIHAYLNRGVILTALTEQPLVNRAPIFWDTDTFKEFA